MGWLYTRIPSWFKTKDEYLRDACKCDSTKAPGYQNTVLKSAFVGSTWYAAVEIKRPEMPPRVVAFIFLTSTVRGEFGYKAMDETVGPCEVSCPLSIMKLLTPVVDTDSHAADWRERVYAHHKQQGEVSGIEERFIGKKIRFAEPLTYGGIPVPGGLLERLPTGRAKRKRLVIRHHGMLCAVRKEDLLTATLDEPVAVPPPPPRGGEDGIPAPTHLVQPPLFGLH